MRSEWTPKYATTTTVSWSQTPVDARFDRRILRCSLFDAPTVVSGVSLSLEPGSGTVSRPLCAQPTCPLNGSNGHWRRFCLFETTARLWLFCLRRAGYKFSDIHTYRFSSDVCVCVYVCVCVVVCRGTSSGLTHSENVEAAFRQHRSRYANCTYVDGNVELVFLNNQTNYNLSFLQVLLVTLNRRLCLC